MDFMELAKARYSVRKYKTVQVEDEKIRKILEAGMVAPTAKNSQPQKIYVLKSEDALKKINEVSPCIYGAPLVFMVGYDIDRAASLKDRPDYDFGEMDASIVTTHMMLEAADLGLGSCWVGKFNDVEVEKKFDLPENVHIRALLPVGYPADDSEPIEMHFNCRPDEEVIEYL